jgi:2-polyprenyl-3-methyl-5-hydroxy-6-metoxy-1,4-benzoquinol methylase
MPAAIQLALPHEQFDRILDVPRGAGRHSLELARRGYRVTGVDLSRDAVERAQWRLMLNTCRLNLCVKTLATWN